MATPTELWQTPGWPQFVLEHLPIGVVTIGPDFRVTYFNPMAERITGYRTEEVLGRPCAEVLQDGSCQGACPVRTVLHQGNPSLLLESTLVHRRGHKIPVRMQVAALFEPGARLCGAVEAFEDARKLKTLEQERAGTLSIFAHDMRSPLVTVAGLLGRLLEGRAGELEPAQMQYLQVIQQIIQRVYTLSQDFLDVARLGRDGGSLAMVEVDLAQILRLLMDEYLERGRETGLRFSLELPPSLPLVQAEPDRLQRVFQNLLDNAIKYAGQGRVRLRVTLEAQSICVEVADRGPGLSAQDLGKLFQPFQRGSAAAGKEGSGLGLAAAAAIVQAHGGRLQGRNRPGGGASFLVTLPIF